MLRIMSELVQQPPTPAGWHPEPGTGHLRWWDGHRWGGYAPPQQLVAQQPRPLKDIGIAYLLALLLGGFGAHNFYAGNTAAGVIQLVLTVLGVLTSWLAIGFLFIGAVLVWVIVDLFMLPSYIRQANARLGY